MSRPPIQQFASDKPVSPRRLAGMGIDVSSEQNPNASAPRLKMRELGSNLTLESRRH
jgi:hypothetical protein